MSDMASDAARDREILERKRAEKIKSLKRKEIEEKASKAHHQLETLYKRAGQMGSALNSLYKEIRKLEKEAI
jgi:hypothetical protein